MRCRRIDCRARSVASSEAERLSATDVTMTGMHGHRSVWLVLLAVLASGSVLVGQTASAPAVTVVRPARVFDGRELHEGWAVRIRGERIEAAGPDASVTAPGARVVDLPGATLMPGLIEGHSHILLHAYNETSWDDQVLREGLALRAAQIGRAHV